MTELKTARTGKSVQEFLDGIADESRRADGFRLIEMMSRITGCEAEMWGASIVGFSSYSYTDARGKRHNWMATGFSPRKSALTIYIMPGFSAYGDLLGRLGKHKNSKSCLYVKRLTDIDEDVLEAIIGSAFRHMREKYG